MNDTNRAEKVILEAVECGLLHSPSAGNVEVLVEYDDGTEHWEVQSVKQAAEDLCKQDLVNYLQNRVDAVKNMFATEEFFEKAYELYRLDWMMNRGITMKDIYKVHDGWFEERESMLGEDADGLPRYFEAYLEDNGFNGELWACKDEFRECEFTSKPYIMSLFKGANRVWLMSKIDKED